MPEQDPVVEAFLSGRSHGNLGGSRILHLSSFPEEDPSY